MPTDADRTQEISFANHIIGDWDDAMDGFFRAVERKMRARNLTPAQVGVALDIGYGEAVADNWYEWTAE
jgi:hypothetical protein